MCTSAWTCIASARRSPSWTTPATSYATVTSPTIRVVLLLSNVVQNAIIGNDNSLVGGLLGAVVLVGMNAAVSRAVASYPRLHRWSCSAIATLVERQSRFLLPVELGQGRLAGQVRGAGRQDHPAARAAHTVADLGSGQGNGRPCRVHPVHRGHRRAGGFL